MNWNVKYLPEAVEDLRKLDDDILIVVIGAREDDEVYEIAQQRISKYHL